MKHQKTMCVVVLSMLCLVSNQAQAGTKRYPSGPYKVKKVKRIFDGDTAMVDTTAYLRVKKENAKIRFRGINTPEKKTRLQELQEIAPVLEQIAQEASEYTKSRMTEKKAKIKLNNVTIGTFGRFIADVEVDGSDLANELEMRHLACRYKRSRKKKIIELTDLASTWVIDYKMFHPENPHMPQKLRAAVAILKAKQAAAKKKT